LEGGAGISYTLDLVAASNGAGIALADGGNSGRRRGHGDRRRGCVPGQCCGEERKNEHDDGGGAGEHDVALRIILMKRLESAEGACLTEA
jgi:hypothetical protein